MTRTRKSIIVFCTISLQLNNNTLRIASMEKLEPGTKVRVGSHEAEIVKYLAQGV